MKFGTYLSGRHGAEDLVHMAQVAERFKFDSLWLGDHIVLPKTFDRSRYPYGSFTATSANNVFECISVLCYLAGKVSSPKLGLSTLVVPYRNPILAAKMLATLDVLSNGRLILGVGTGWMKEEFEVLGAPSYEERGRVTDEYLELFIELWTRDDPNYHGKYCQVSGIGFLPKPVQKPHPPIWVGGHTRRAFQRIARYGKGWQPVRLMPLEITEKLAILRRICEEAGRNPDEIETAVSGRLQFLDGPGTAGHERRPLAGTPQQIADDIHRYQEVGVVEMRLLVDDTGVQGVVDTWERFVQEVRPKL